MLLPFILPSIKTSFIVFILILGNCHAQVGVSYLNVESNEIKAVPYDKAPDIERRIKKMDIYSLSKYARLLRMTHIVTPYIAPKNGRVKQAIKDWEVFILEASKKYNIPSNLIKAVIEVESGAMNKAVSEKGAQGLMQLMPKTALDLGVKDPFNPKENIHAGTLYLKKQIDRFEGNLSLALAAYNAGPYNVITYKGVPPFKETISFVNKVLNYYQNLNQN